MMEEKNKSQSKAKTEAKKTKRGHYEQKECPYCHKHVGNLGNHIKFAHPNEQPINPQVELNKEDLIQGKKPVPTGAKENVYYCSACRARLRQGENPCWHCGEVLNWEAIK